MRRLLPGVAALAAGWVFSLWAYGRLPDQVAIHWNARLEADGYASPFFAAVLLPTIMLVAVPALAVVLRMIDPRKESQRRHEPTWWFVWSMLMMLLAALQVMVVANGLGWIEDPTAFLGVALGACLLAMGNWMPRIKPNWFFGIRTPWTLDNDYVWRATHRLAGWTFMIGGVVVMIAGLIGVSWLLPAGALAACVTPAVYSFVISRRGEAQARA